MMPFFMSKKTIIYKGRICKVFKEILHKNVIYMYVLCGSLLTWVYWSEDHQIYDYVVRSKPNYNLLNSIANKKAKNV